MPKPVYLLDTNIVSDLMRRPAGRIRDCIAERGENSVCTSIVVAAELRFSATKKGSAQLSAQLEAALDAFDILPFEEPADRRYADIWTALERAGTPIGANAMLIAAHALALGLILVTNNTAEFRRVVGLRVENWLDEWAQRTDAFSVTTRFVGDDPVAGRLTPSRLEALATQGQSKMVATVMAKIEKITDNARPKPDSTRFSDWRRNNRFISRIGTAPWPLARLYRPSARRTIPARTGFSTMCRASSVR